MGIAKEILGAFGALLMAIPWFYDHRWRVVLARFGKIKSNGAFGQLVKEETDEIQKQMNAPNMRNWWLTTIGLLMVLVSFLLGICIEYQK